MKYLDSRGMRRGTPALALIVALLVASTPCFAQENECFEFEPPLLLDTTDNCGAYPTIPRAIQTKIMYWNGKTELVYNRGNELSIVDITNPLSPIFRGSSSFNVPPAGDRDQNLFNYAICDDCRYGMAGFSEMGAMLFDLGTDTSPGFVDWQYHPDAADIGAVAFESGGQEYILVNRFPGCVGTSGLYRFNGIQAADLQLVECVTAGSGTLDVNGGFYLPGSPSYLWVVDGGEYGHIYRIDAGSPISLTYLGSPFRAALNWDQGLAVDLNADLAVTARNGIIDLYDISSPGSPDVLAHWQPNSARRYGSVAIKYPYLWVGERGLRETLTYSIVNPGTPVRIGEEFWEYTGDNPQPWNTYPCMDNRHAVFTDDAGWLFVARFSVLERFQVLDSCLDNAPRAMVSVTPAEVFPGDQVTVTNTTTSPYETAAVWVEDQAGALVVGSGVMSSAEPTSRSFEVPIAPPGGAAYTAWVAVATTAYPCADPLDNPTACGDQVVSQAITINRQPEAIIVVTPSTAVTGDTVELDGSSSEGHPQSLLWEISLDGVGYTPPPPFDDGAAVNQLELAQSGEWRFDLTASYAHTYQGSPWSHTDTELMAVSSVAADFEVDTADPVNTAEITLCFTGMIAPDVSSVDYGWEVADNADMSGLRWSSSSCTTVAGCADCGVVIPAETLPGVDHTYWVELTLENTDPSHGGFGDVSTAQRSMSVSGDPCTYTITPTSASYGAGGGTGSVTVTASAAGCTWTATSAASWITITAGSSGSGNGTVLYAVAPNTECGSRTGYMTIAGRTFTVTEQGASCEVNFTYTPSNPQIGDTVTFIVEGSVTPVSWDFGGLDCDGSGPTMSCTAWPSLCMIVEWEYATAGAKSVTFTAQEGSLTRSVEVGSAGTCDEGCEADGPPVASFTMAPDPAQVGEVVTFTDTSGKKNLAVDFTWSPVSPMIGQSVTFHISGVGSVTSAVWDFGADGCGGYTQSTTCTPAPPFVDCMYQPYEYGEGGTFNVSLRASGGAAITKQISVQNTGSCGGECTYSISPTSASFPAAGGSGSVSVATDAGCGWTATANASWIQITAGSTGSGPGTVAYTVDANTGIQRAGTMTIAGSVFQVTQAAGGGGENTAPTEWQWTIRLGSEVVVTSEEQSFSHAFDAPGDYEVTLEAGNCVGSDTEVQTLVVTGDAIPEAFVVPAAAHVAGLHDTLWRTDLAIFNPGAEEVTATVVFLPEATDNSGGSSYSLALAIPARGTDVQTDLVGEMGAGVDLKGSLWITFEEGDGTTPVIMSRTYNDTPDGTYGQFVPAVPVPPSVGGELHLSGLSHNDAYRTNLGVANLDQAEAATVAIRLTDAAGVELGSCSRQVLPSSSLQVVNLLTACGATAPVDLYSVEVSAGEHDVAVYASLVDNATGDPVLYVPYLLAASDVYVPGVAHLPGANGSLWRSDITFFNPTAEAMAASLVYVPETDLGELPDVSLDLDPGEALFMPDVLGDPAVVGGEVETKGYFVVSSEDDGPAPMTAARTYNQAPEGTFGQGLKVYDSAFLVAEGGTADIPGVVHNTEFRTNLGLLNSSPDAAAAVAIRVYDQLGTLIGSHAGYPLAAEQYVQFDLFAAVGLGEAETYASVELEVVSGGPVAAYASVIDNRTQDPILVPAQAASSSR